MDAQQSPKSCGQGRGRQVVGSKITDQFESGFSRVCPSNTTLTDCYMTDIPISPSSSLLTDPKSRKVIIIEHPLLPLHIKDMFAKILFTNLQVRFVLKVRHTHLTREIP